MSDEAAFFALVKNNRQGELSPLEIGLSALAGSAIGLIFSGRYYRRYIPGEVLRLWFVGRRR